MKKIRILKAVMRTGESAQKASGTPPAVGVVTEFGSRHDLIEVVFLKSESGGDDIGVIFEELVSNTLFL